MLFVFFLVVCLVCFIEAYNCFTPILSISTKRTVSSIPLTAKPPTSYDSCSDSSSDRESLIRKLFPTFLAFNLIATSKITRFIADAATQGLEADPVAAASKPLITQKVFLDIKIANYTEESIGRNRGAYGSGRVVFGLYGKDAPKSVEVFLRSILSDGSTVPSFINSQFSRVSEEGVLELERVRGLNTVLLAGSEQFEFGGEVMDYQPILESNSIRHSRAGLLTRRQLTSGPLFGITLRNSEELDAFHVVFGEVLEGQDVLQAISSIPTYTYTTKTGYGGSTKGIEGDLADKWFSAQKTLFVTAGKTFGDKRAVDRRGQPLR
eukprot:gene24218-31482_t